MDDYLKCKESEIYEGKDTASMNSFHLIFLLDFKQTKDKEKKK